MCSEIFCNKIHLYMQGQNQVHEPVKLQLCIKNNKTHVDIFLCFLFIQCKLIFVMDFYLFSSSLVNSLFIFKPIHLIFPFQKTYQAAYGEGKTWYSGAIPDPSMVRIAQSQKTLSDVSGLTFAAALFLQLILYSEGLLIHSS